MIVIGTPAIGGKFNVHGEREKALGFRNTPPQADCLPDIPHLVTLGASDLYLGPPFCSRANGAVGHLRIGEETGGAGDGYAQQQNHRQ